MAGMLNCYHSFYDSEEYREAIGGAIKDASHDGSPADRFPNLPREEWDGRFIAALLERGLAARHINDPFVEGKPFPLMAPAPFDNGYPYPAHIVSLRKEHRSE